VLGDWLLSSFHVSSSFVLFGPEASINNAALLMTMCRAEGYPHLATSSEPPQGARMDDITVEKIQELST